MRHLVFAVLCLTLLTLTACAEDTDTNVEALEVTITLDSGATLQRTYQGPAERFTAALDTTQARADVLNTQLEAIAVESNSVGLYSAEVTLRAEGGDQATVQLHVPPLAPSEDAFTLEGLHRELGQALQEQGFTSDQVTPGAELETVQQEALPDECGRILLWVYCNWQSADGSGTNGCDCFYGLEDHCWGNCGWRE